MENQMTIEELKEYQNTLDPDELGFDEEEGPECPL
jgi:hypothetical protein